MEAGPGSRQRAWKVLENAHKKVLESHRKTTFSFCTHPVIDLTLAGSSSKLMNCHAMDLGPWSALKLSLFFFTEDTFAVSA